MLTDLATETTLSKEQAQLYTAALSALYQQFKNGDYDLNNLYASIM